MVTIRRVWALVAAVLVVALLPLVPNSAAVEPGFAETSRSELLDGVGQLVDPTQAGKMVVYGEDSFVVANFAGQDESDPLIAAATWGSGRVIAMGDHQFLNMNRYGDDANGNPSGSGTLYLNGIEWLTETDDLGIKIVVARSGAKEWLESQGFTNVIETSNWVDELGDADVLLGWLGASVSDADLQIVENFVTSGGGLFIAEYGVGYQWWWSGDIPAAPANRLLRPVGIGFASGYGGGLTPEPATAHYTSSDVLGVLATPADYRDDEQVVLGEMARRLLQVLPDEDSLRAQLEIALQARAEGLSPTPATPVSDPVDKATLTFLSNQLATMPVDELVKHPLADTLYGEVPADAARATATVAIDTNDPRWQPTGLYAAPGETVTITVPPSLVGSGYRIRVNAHTDDISRRDSWERPPIVHRWFEIDDTTIEVGNAFGGLIFIDFRTSPPELGEVDLTVAGAVEAPFFVLGTHTNAEWNTELRNRPAPFAILVSDTFMISLPKHQVESADLTDPERLMTWWNDVVAAQDELTAQSRSSAELANVDVQISAGAAHSGYPYQAYEKHWGNMADLDRLLTRGSWGDFHELGHNHQRGWWTFDGDVEVSVNIMSNLSMERFASDPQGGWAWSTSPESVLQHATFDVSEGGTYSSKRNRWSFWFQLADGFGWDAYRNVFAGYEADHAAGRSLPSSNAEEKDQWLIRFSREVGFDLSKFMVDTWGLEVSQSARDSLSDLPGWMPLWTYAEPQTHQTRNLEPVTIDFTDKVYAMGEFTVSIDGAAGTVTALSDLSWSYQPAPALVAQDDFAIVIRSSAGNTVEVPVTVYNLDLPAPTPTPTPEPTAEPTVAPTVTPTAVPDPEPSVAPTATPTAAPDPEPTAEPTPEVPVTARCHGQLVTIDMTANGGNGTGTDGDDVILGTPGNDVIVAGDGNDLVCAGDGDDVVVGGAGADHLDGGPGADVIRGNEGDDLIHGGIGPDRLMGGIGEDEILGGTGDDFIGGFGGADNIDAGPGNDTVYGGFGADHIRGGLGDDVIRGLIGNDVIFGDAGNDQLHGDRGADVLHGGSGDDTIGGGNANDQLNGDDGDDELSGGRADDTLSGGPGSDICVGNKELVADTADDSCESVFGVR